MRRSIMMLMVACPIVLAGGLALSDQAAPPAASQPVDPDSTAKAALDRMLPNVEFNATGLTDACNLLGVSAKTKIRVNGQSLAKAGVNPNSPVTAHVKNTKLADVLRQMLDNASPKTKLGWTIDKGVIVIVVPGDPATKALK